MTHSAGMILDCIPIALRAHTYHMRSRCALRMSNVRRARSRIMRRSSLDIFGGRDRASAGGAAAGLADSAIEKELQRGKTVSRIERAQRAYTPQLTHEQATSEEES